MARKAKFTSRNQIPYIPPPPPFSHTPTILIAEVLWLVLVVGVVLSKIL